MSLDLVAAQVGRADLSERGPEHQVRFIEAEQPRDANGECLAAALAGALSDVQAEDVAPLGIGVTVVAPDAFRTDFAARLAQALGGVDPGLSETAGRARAGAQAGHVQQQGACRGRSRHRRGLGTERHPSTC